MKWDGDDHATLAALFRGKTDTPAGAIVPYAGYKPDVREAPNGDMKACPAGCEAFIRRGRADRSGCSYCHGTGHVPNVDAGPAGKRYLHVATKYNPPDWALDYLARAHFEACRIAERIGVPAAYYPRAENGTLRVLEYPSAGHVFADAYTDYPCKHCGVRLGALKGSSHEVCPVLAPGAGTAEHKDFDLFTINLWRSTPEDHEQYEPYGGRVTGRDTNVWTRGAPAYHIGEIGELVGLGRATLHRVPARPYTQRAIVYFAIPDHAARLPCCTRYAGAALDAHETIVHMNVRPHSPCGPTVGVWLDERMKRSRQVYR